MPRRKAANMVKGCAWLFLAAAVLPTFSTSGEATGEVTELTVGLPWSPWLNYRESWLPASVQTEGPAFGHATTFNPRSGSTIAFLIGMALLATSRLMKISGEKKGASRPLPAGYGSTGALRA
ncbi:MAG TPA: hypothetical protein VHC22_02545 [Pirellulales bacterium]|nr:hypothetical protein [Pirellulales bacterium]